MKGKITSPGSYSDNTPRFEIGIYIDDEKELPHTFHQRLEYNLKIGDKSYLAGLNSSEQSGLWISPDVYEPGTIEKLRLCDILLESGFNKNEEIEIIYDKGKNELRVENIVIGFNSGSIRRRALNWYEKTYGRIDKPIYATKLYSPSQSWTKDYVWFVQIPIKEIEKESNSNINILCQEVINGSDFYHLRIEREFFEKNIDSFDRIKNHVALYLSPRDETFFQELRGGKMVDFKPFLVNH